MTILAPKPRKTHLRPRARPVKNRASLAPPQPILFHDVTWRDYLQLGKIFHDRSGLRLTFDRGTLEIMVTSREHEAFKTRLGRLIEILAEVFNLEIEPGGNMTFQNEDVQKGLEGDNCWWIEHARQVLGKLTWDVNVDPPPDLLLEIEVSRTAVSRMAIYAALKVPQVWCFDGRSLRVYVLQATGDYLQVRESPTFPGISIKGIVRFVEPRKDYLKLQKEFRRWIKQQRARKPGKRRST